MRPIFQAGLIVVLLAAGALAESQAIPASSASYVDKRTWHEQALASGPTKAQRIEYMRELVRSGPYGEQGLNRIFKNFEGRGAIDPGIPGVEKNIRLASSQNSNVRKGAARTQLYAAGLHNDGRFALSAVNKKVYGPDGRMVTDQDLAYKHRSTGRAGHIEVKDVAPDSQRRNLDAYKRQIDKLAYESGRTGSRQVYLNRQELIPELQEHAIRKGVLAFGHVRTGQAGPPRGMSYQEVLDQLDRLHRIESGVGLAGRAFGAGLGAWMVYENAPGAWEAWSRSMDPTTRTMDGLLRFGERSSRTAMGAALVVEGGASLGTTLSKSGASLARWSRVAKWSGRLAWPLLAVGEGFAVARWASGGMSNREFIVDQSRFAGGLGGGIAGAWAGGKGGAAIGAGIGSLIPGVGTAAGAGIGAVVGTIGGGFAGAYYGQAATGWVAEDWYARLDSKQQKALTIWVYYELYRMKHK